MPALYTAPVASGKTTWVLRRAQALARAGRWYPRVVVPGRLQAAAARRRLAALGGALGVRVLTFYELAREVLAEAGQPIPLLPEPVRFRLLRRLAEQTPPELRQAAATPGFLRLVERLFAEWEGAEVTPEALRQAQVGDPLLARRLAALADLFAAYRERLEAWGFADAPGLLRHAVEALEANPALAKRWPFLAFDGFDDFTPLQLRLLSRLAQRVEETVVTLTAPDPQRPLVFARLRYTLQAVQRALGVEGPQPLPAEDLADAALPASFVALRQRWFAGAAEEGAMPPDGAVTLLEVPQRRQEVREALRWLKERILRDGVPVHETALLVRQLDPYRAHLLATAAEFGLPLWLVDGLPLASNPAVNAVLDLLRLALPADETTPTPEPALPYRGVLAAWRSPYFAWTQATADPQDPQPIGITPADADALDAVARWGQVLGGLTQWREAFAALAARPPIDAEEAEAKADETSPALPVGEALAALQERFERFVRRITPPPGARPWADWIAWLEDLLGEDPADALEEGAATPAPHSLRVVARAAEGPDPALARRDLAALRTFKEVLRGLLWAADALNEPPVDFPTFFRELAAAVEAAYYDLPLPADPGQVILVADVFQARGLSFQAVALLGLAEGEFPQALQEDPLIPDAARRDLQRLGWRLDLAEESREAQVFYEALLRPRRALLLTRPLLAENGAAWAPSPFWEEVVRVLGEDVVRRQAGMPAPPPDRVASLSEALETAAQGATPPLAALRPAWPHLERAAQVLRQRTQTPLPPQGLPFEGDLTALKQELVARYGPGRVWSASRLESYLTCPLFFFFGSVLGLAPRPEPQEGMDPRQLGAVYHSILEVVYHHAIEQEVSPEDAEALIALLEALAPPILERAPQQEGFRATPWWEHTRNRMLDLLRQNLRALAERSNGFRPYRVEAPFGLRGEPPFEARREDRPGDVFRLRGYIDRLDIAPDGRGRIVDYKTGSQDRKSKLEEGRLLQLPLYALAAEERFGVRVTEVWYWALGKAQPMPEKRDAELEDLKRQALERAWETVDAIRAGRFAPQPPSEGCPSYCPAAAFCWRYRPKRF